jgi:hypothetical protein
MKERQLMIEQVNGILHYFSDEGRARLPSNFVNFFKKNAQKSPSQVINPNVPLAEQDLCDDTLLMLVFINKILKAN